MLAEHISLDHSQIISFSCPPIMMRGFKLMGNLFIGFISYITSDVLVHKWRASQIISFSCPPIMMCAFKLMGNLFIGFISYIIISILNYIIQVLHYEFY